MAAKVVESKKSKNPGMEQTVKNPVQGIRNTITSYLKRPRSQVLAERPLQQQKQLLQQSPVQYDHGQGQPTSQLCLADQLANVSTSVLPLGDHPALSLTKQVSSKQDQEQLQQSGIVPNAKPVAADRSLGQPDHGHDHNLDHNLDDHSWHVDVDSDHKQNPNLEAPVNTTGMVWVDDDNVDSIAVDNDDNGDKQVPLRGVPSRRG